MFAKDSSATDQADTTTAPRNRSRWLAVAGLAAAGSMILVPQFTSGADAVAGFATTATPRVAIVPTPLPGSAWIEGVLTDQAGHKLDAVNVEAWSQDPDDEGPVASNLTYAGDDPADPRHQHGVFRLEVPAGQAYRVTLSTVGGLEDGDRFRMQSVSGGRPIMAGPVASTATAGRVINIGTYQLVRQGTVVSKTSARLAHPRIKAGRRAVLQVRVSSPWVTNVTGTVQIKVSGMKRTMTRRLAATAHGNLRVVFPKLARGKHTVSVVFTGTDSVARSQARVLRLTVGAK